jgi:hypothetical protein
MKTLPRHVCLALLFLTGSALVSAATVIEDTSYSAGTIAVVSAGSDSISTQDQVVVHAGARVTYHSAATITLSPGFHAEAGSRFRAGSPVDHALYQGITFQPAMQPGGVQLAKVTFVNTGAWTWDGSYQLTKSSNPGNGIGLSATVLAAPSTAPGQTAQFSITLTAPLEEGIYRFPRWRMVRDGAGEFGELSPEVYIQVGAGSDAFDGLPPEYHTDSNGNGIPDAVEVALGLDPYAPYVPPEGSLKEYQYDVLNRLSGDPKNLFEYDTEGNLEGTTPKTPSP